MGNFGFGLPLLKLRFSNSEISIQIQVQISLLKHLGSGICTEIRVNFIELKVLVWEIWVQIWIKAPELKLGLLLNFKKQYKTPSNQHLIV